MGDEFSGVGPLMLILFLGAFSADSFSGLPLTMRPGSAELRSREWRDWRLFLPSWCGCCLYMAW